MPTAPVYEARYGFPTDCSRLLGLCTAFALGSLVVPLPWGVRLAEFVIFAVAGVAVTVIGLRATRLAALRADETGLTIGGSVLRYASTTTTVPWKELRAVKIARQSGPPHLPVVTADRKGKAEPVSKPVKGWRLDVKQLGDTMLSLAPAVRLNDQRQG